MPASVAGTTWADRCCRAERWDISVVGYRLVASRGTSVEKGKEYATGKPFKDDLKTIINHLSGSSWWNSKVAHYRAFVAKSWSLFERVGMVRLYRYAG
jgi:hypothetical protein